jgi:hypothetical protein
MDNLEISGNKISNSGTMIFEQGIIKVKGKGLIEQIGDNYDSDKLNIAFIKQLLPENFQTAICCNVDFCSGRIKSKNRIMFIISDERSDLPC